MQAHLLRMVGRAIVLSVMLTAGVAQAAPYAAMVMDARNGEVIFARNHDTQLHPASLTKMMTLYVAFEAIKHGEVTLDTQFTVSKRATGATCVCLGLREGQRISLRYLIRAAALRSANDASIVIAEGISGSVEAFAERMTRTARAMGMNNTTFRNPHGLTQTGHVSTARDMTILGRHLYFDYPQYFNLFSRRSEHAGVATVPNTNRRFLDAYTGADGIKTGYTRAAGFNLTASAKRGSRHIIATMFGGSSAAARNAHVAELMDIGFARANARVATRAPRTPDYQGPRAVAQAPSTPARNGDDDPSAAAKTIRLQLAVRRSLRPQPRPDGPPDADMLLAVQQSVEATVSAAAEDAERDGGSRILASVAPDALAVSPRPRPDDLVAPAVEDDIALAIAAGFGVADPDDLAALEDAEDQSAPEAPEMDVAATSEDEDLAEPPAEVLLADSTTAGTPPPTRPEAETEIAAELEAARVAPEETVTDLAEADQPPADETLWIGSAETFLPDPAQRAPLPAAPVSLSLNADLGFPSPEPSVQPDPDIILTSTPATDRAVAQSRATARAAEARPVAEGEVVSRVSTSDSGRIWGVSLGQFTSRAAAERGLITVKMAEAAALGNGVSRIRQTSGRFEATVAGLTEAEAERACLRLTARMMDCDVARP